jgi:hypothetical protein
MLSMALVVNGPDTEEDGLLNGGDGGDVCIGGEVLAPDPGARITNLRMLRKKNSSLKLRWKPFSNFAKQ